MSQVAYDAELSDIVGLKAKFLLSISEFSISKRLRLLGNIFSHITPHLIKKYFTNLNLIAHFVGFNEPNFIILIKNKS